MSLLDRTVVVAGAALWLATWFSLKLPLEAAILLFAPLVLVNPALGLVLGEDQSQDRGTLTWIRRLHWLGAVPLAVSFVLPQGVLAAVLAAPWLIVTFALGGVGLVRIWRQGMRLDGDLAVTAALLLIPVGGVWAVISRAGLRPQEFSHAIVLLTAAHFHYAGFVLPLVAGLTLRDIKTRAIDKIMLLSIILGVPLVGVGISLSPPIEVAAALMLTIGCGLLAVRQLQAAWLSKNPTRLALASASSLALASAMGLAGVYAAGEYLGQTWIDIPTMIRTHGACNAFGFAACGLASRVVRC